MSSPAEVVDSSGHQDGGTWEDYGVSDKAAQSSKGDASLSAMNTTGKATPPPLILVRANRGRTPQTRRSLRRHSTGREAQGLGDPPFDTPVTVDIEPEVKARGVASRRRGRPSRRRGRGGRGRGRRVRDRTHSNEHDEGRSCQTESDTRQDQAQSDEQTLAQAVADEKEGQTLSDDANNDNQTLSEESQSQLDISAMGASETGGLSQLEDSSQVEADVDGDQSGSSKKTKLPHTCGHCGEVIAKVRALKQHLLTKHQLMYRIGLPDGMEDDDAVLRALGYLKCLKCGVKYLCIDSFKEHTESCTATGEEVHKSPDKQEEETTDAKDGDSTDRSVTFPRAARQAARRAMQQFKEWDLRMSRNQADEYADSSEDEANFEDHFESDESEGDMDLEDESPSQRRSRRGEGSKLLRDLRKMAPVEYYWEESKAISHTWYSAHHKGVLEHFCPTVDKWVPLASEEAEKYLPNDRLSVSFCEYECPSEKRYKSANTGETTATEPSLESCQIGLFQSTGNADSQFLYCGGPVWSLAWCPVPLDVTVDQYLALYCHQRFDQLTDRLNPSSGPSMIQLWNCGKLVTGSEPTAQLSCGFALDYGAIFALCWCPFGGWIEDSKNTDFSRLGLLAAATASGYIALLSVPHLHSLPDAKGDFPIYKVAPSAVLTPAYNGDPDTLCSTLDWHTKDNCNHIAAGYSDGSVALYDLGTCSPLLRTKDSATDTLTFHPYCVFKAHPMAISSVAFCHRVDNILATSGQDKGVRFWNLEQLDVPMQANTRSTVTKLVWPHHCPFVCVAQDNCFSLERNVTMHIDNRILTGYQLTSHMACVWDMTVSDWLNAIASCDQDGEVHILTLGHWRSINKNTRHFRRRFVLCETAMESVDSEQTANGLPQGSGNSDDPSNETTSVTNDKDELGTSCQKQSPDTAEQKLVYRNVWKQCNPHAETAVYNLWDAPTAALYRIAWNPNSQCYTWLAFGGQNGLLRLMNITGLKPVANI